MPPKLVYDDDCRFCTWATTFVIRRSDVVPVPLSELRSGESPLADGERERLPDGYEECAQLLTDDAVYSCGEAMEQSFVVAGVLPAELAEFLRKFGGYERLRETVYRLVSDNRDLVSTVIQREPPARRHASDERRASERSRR